MARQKQHEDIDHDISLVWMTEALHRQKRLKPLKSLLSRRDADKKPERQTPQQMRDVLQKLGMKPKPMHEDTKKSLKYIRVQ